MLTKFKRTFTPANVAVLLFKYLMLSGFGLFALWGVAIISDILVAPVEISEMSFIFLLGGESLAFLLMPFYLLYDGLAAVLVKRPVFTPVGSGLGLSGWGDLCVRSFDYCLKPIGLKRTKSQKLSLKIFSWIIAVALFCGMLIMSLYNLTNLELSSFNLIPRLPDAVYLVSAFASLSFYAVYLLSTLIVPLLILPIEYIRKSRRRG